MTDDGADEPTTMDDVDHTHPHTDAPFGESGVYDRGPETGDDEPEPEDDTDDDGGGRRATVRRVDDDGEPVRTDGGTEVPSSQPAWAVHDVSDDDR